MKSITILVFSMLLFQGASFGQASGKQPATEKPATDPAFEKYCEANALNLIALPAGKGELNVAGEITLRNNATYRDYGIVLKESETQYYKVTGSDKVMQVMSVYRLRVGYEAQQR
jgi:hypothetical protein